MRTDAAAADVGRCVRFENGDARVVHGHDHGRGAALFGDAPHDAGGARQAEAHAAAVSRTQNHEVGFGQCLDGLDRKCAVLVDGGRVLGDGLAPRFSTRLRRFVQ